MRKRGQIKYIPDELLRELKNVKIVDGITSDAEAFRKMSNYSILGRMSKKGTVIDLIFIISMLFVLGISIFFYHYISTQIHTGLLTSELNQSTETVQALTAIDKTNGSLDYLYFFVAIGLFISSVIFAWFIGGYLLFAIFYFIIIAITVIVAAVLANTWETIVGNVIFTSTLAALPLTNYLLSHLPVFVIAFGLLSMLALFAKPMKSGYQ